MSILLYEMRLVFLIYVLYTKSISINFLNMIIIFKLTNILKLFLRRVLAKDNIIDVSLIIYICGLFFFIFHI